MSSCNLLYFQREAACSLPLMDVYETSEDIVLEMDLPGIDPKDVLIKVYEDVIIVEGVKREGHREKKLRYICMERNFESFRRIIKVPVPVDAAAGKAWYDHGVITVTFPKLKERVIKISIENKEE